MIISCQKIVGERTEIGVYLAHVVQVAISHDDGN